MSLSQMSQNKQVSINGEITGQLPQDNVFDENFWIV